MWYNWYTCWTRGSRTRGSMYDCHTWSTRGSRTRGSRSSGVDDASVCTGDGRTAKCRSMTTDKQWVHRAINAKRYCVVRSTLAGSRQSINDSHWMHFNKRTGCRPPVLRTCRVLTTHLQDLSQMFCVGLHFLLKLRQRSLHSLYKM